MAKPKPEFSDNNIGDAILASFLSLSQSKVVFFEFFSFSFSPFFLFHFIFFFNLSFFLSCSFWGKERWQRPECRAREYQASIMWNIVCVTVDTTHWSGGFLTTSFQTPVFEMVNISFYFSFLLHNVRLVVQELQQEPNNLIRHLSR